MRNPESLVDFVGATLIVIFLAGCSASTPTTTYPIVGVTEKITQPPPTPTIPLPTPLPVLDERPLIFFNPLPHPNGSLDFMNLFTVDAPWEQSAQQVHVFELFGGWVVHFPWEPPEATDAELEQIVKDLNRRGMAIAFGASPLVATDNCGKGIEGFFGPEEGLGIARKLKALGAEVRYVSLDEPFAFGHIYSGANACQWTAEKIAGQVHVYIEAIHSIYPEAIIGDDEPLWAGVDPQEIIGWLDTYQAVTGEALPFLHLDLDFSRPDWPQAAKQIEEATKTRGVEFGIFYLGDAGDATDAEWLNKAFERARRYELEAGGQPDHVIFASWHPRPDAVLPETNSDTFTGLLLRYFLPRPSLTLSLDSTATGTLTDPSGTPLVGADITLTLSSLGEIGLIAEYSLSGTVPAGASLANVGLRVNQECGCQGESDFYLYDASYLEGDEALNRVPNSYFSNRLTSWEAWGSAPIRLELSDRGSGMMLHVWATPDQDLGMNSGSFTVTPGVTYRVTFTARVSPSSVGSGYFALFFLTPQREISRQIIHLAPGSVPLGEVVTGTQGEYRLPFGSLIAGDYLLEADYGGNRQYWPAWASLKFSIP
jgi:hypothetical protein